MTTDIKPNRPEPIRLDKEVRLFNRKTDVAATIVELEAGKSVLVKGLYSNGLSLLKSIQYHLKKQSKGMSFKSQREYRNKYRKLSNQILLEIVDHKLVVRKSPEIGWLEKLYPETGSFFLPLPQVQGLNSSWQWYQNGIAIPVLRNKLHPFYGTYFPTRFDHLILFDNWLKRYNGPKKSAIDVGVGSGILSFQLVKHGFQKVFATDTNPNAIVGLIEAMGDTKMSRKIDLDHGNLFGKFDKPSELIVFNPPWLPESKDLDGIDTAMYYNKNLFPDFFAAAKTRLAEDGKLVVLFSNLAQITEVTKEHPIEKELKDGGRFKLEAKLTRKVKLASTKTNRDQNWRELEEVELWILNLKKS